MKRLVVILILAFGLNNIKAQVAPGYMGKRLLVEYSGSTAPAIFRVNQNGNKGFDPIPPEFNLPFNYGHKFTLNYTLNRKSAIGASFEMYNTGVNYENTNIQIVDWDGNDNYYKSETRLYSPDGYGVVKINGISLFYQKYKNGIAPLGKHSNFGFKLLFVNTEMDSANFIGNKREGGEEEVIAYTPPSVSSVEWGLFYGLGVNRIIKDRIVISLGFELALIFSAYGEFGKEWDYTDISLNRASNDIYDQVDNNGVNTEADLFKKMSSKRVFSSQFFNIKIGIGFLAY